MMQSQTVTDVILRPVNSEDLVEKSGLNYIRSDVLDVRIGKQLDDDAFLSGIDEMAKEGNERAVPSSTLCGAHSLDCFTMSIAHIDDPLTPMSLIVMDISAKEDVLHMTAQLAFTDAEMRGEGLGLLCAAGASVVLQRAVQSWSDMPGATGDAPSEVIVDANPVSSGGEALLEVIRNAASDMTAKEDFLEPG